MSAVPERRPFEVELSWVTFGAYEVDAADEDAAVVAAIAQAKRDGAEAEQFEVESVFEVEP